MPNLLRAAKGLKKAWLLGVELEGLQRLVPSPIAASAIRVRRL